MSDVVTYVIFTFSYIKMGVFPHDITSLLLDTNGHKIVTLF